MTYHKPKAILAMANRLLNTRPDASAAVALREAASMLRDLASGDAHLAQPAQAVDVGAIEQVAEEMGKDGGWLHDKWMYRLTRAISGENAGRVGNDTLPIDIHGKWIEVPIGVQLHIIMLRDKLKQRESDETLVAVYDAVARSCLTRDVKAPETKARIVRGALLPASPAPDKEG